MYICGDFNSRCGDASDYIEGIDDVRERDIIDVTSNHYGDLLLDFLVDCNFCMINGRVKGKNDFTSVSHRGRSVVDYVLVPHEQLCDIASMSILLMTETIEQFDLNRCDKIPDHSLLLWESNMCAPSIESETDISQNRLPRKRFNVTNIPEDFLNNREAVSLIERTIERIESSISEEHGANSAYSAFMDLLQTEMSSKLKSYSNTQYSKGRKMKCKKYWNEELELQWIKVCEKEKLWLKCKTNNVRKQLKAQYCAERRSFDKLNRRFKRKQQRSKQENLQNLLENDTSRDFWKEIGKLSLANDRKMRIPMEVVDGDGRSIYNTDEILSRWKTDYSELLNPENDQNFDNEHYENIQQQLQGNDVLNNSNLNVESLNSDITYQEVYESVYRAKLRKAAGFDSIPSEVLRFDICIELLHKIISYCFKSGEIPTEWTKGIINPIPKSDTQDARNPLSYRGISLLSVPYKIYADILNQRLTKWLEENKLLVEEQNGFRKKRNCVEHIYTLYSIVNNRKLSKQSTYVCFIDFKKAFDTVNRDLLWYKLMRIGITGRILDAEQSLYVNVQCTVMAISQ